MTAWLASFFAALLPKLIELLWGYASQETKEILAKNALKDYINQLQVNYKKVNDNYEALKLANRLNEQEIERIRHEKILLETELLNSKLSHP